jgi:hypothetical protein
MQEPHQSAERPSVTRSTQYLFIFIHSFLGWWLAARKPKFVSEIFGFCPWPHDNKLVARVAERLLRTIVFDCLAPFDAQFI